MNRGIPDIPEIDRMFGRYNVGSDSIPLVPGSIFGHRVWYRFMSGSLMSPQQGLVWTSSTLTAQCTDILGFRPHPMKSCGCGFYAYFDGFTNDFDDKANVIGVVEGFGETIVGTKGFRSQKMRIVALAPTGRVGWWLDRDDWRNLMKKYPDIKIYRSQRAMFRAHPVTKAGEVV